MKLSTWIDSNGGNAATGKILGIQRNVSYAWRNGVALPRPEMMRAIVKKTRGRVSYGEMVEEFLEKRAKPTRQPRKGKTNAKTNKKGTKSGMNSGPSLAKRLIEMDVKRRKRETRAAKVKPAKAKKSHDAGF